MRSFPPRHFDLQGGYPQIKQVKEGNFFNTFTFSLMDLDAWSSLKSIPSQEIHAQQNRKIFAPPKTD